jgi:hypothetical protein
MYIGIHVKYPLLFSDFNENWIFSTDFRKLSKYQIPWKSVRREPHCSMRTDRLDEASSRFFCNFVNAPKETLFRYSPFSHYQYLSDWHPVKLQRRNNWRPLGYFRQAKVTICLPTWSKLSSESETNGECTQTCAFTSRVVQCLAKLKWKPTWSCLYTQQNMRFSQRYRWNFKSCGIGRRTDF